VTATLAARCEVCPHACLLAEAEIGPCGARHNVAGQIVPRFFGQVVAAHDGPIERSYLYHVTPGARAFGYGAAGCNLRCAYCQNWIVSQTPKSADISPPSRSLPPEALVAEALAAGCGAVVATFTEPGVHLEYTRAVAHAARGAGLLNAWKTNGYLTAGAQDSVAPLLDAVNVDLKTLDGSVAAELLGGSVKPVLEALSRYRAAGVWVEVTTLLVPTVNDSTAHIDALIDAIGERLGADVPWHVNRFHPDFALRHLPPTPLRALHAARERGLERGLRFVYTDAETAGPGLATQCAVCGATLIRREGARVVDDTLRGVCRKCGAVLPGVF
jgi:pyruvate formate lyase activating enzyme